jgi:hypothetical protein
LPLAAPLLERLLSLPKPDHSLLGRIVARSVTAGAIDDKTLWAISLVRSAMMK